MMPAGKLVYTFVIRVNFRVTQRRHFSEENQQSTAVVVSKFTLITFPLTEI